MSEFAGISSLEGGGGGGGVRVLPVACLTGPACSMPPHCYYEKSS